MTNPTTTTDADHQTIVRIAQSAIDENAQLRAEFAAAQNIIAGLRRTLAAARERAERADRLLGIAERTMRYLGWAFKDNLIRRSETAELLDQTLHEWKAAQQ